MHTQSRRAFITSTALLGAATAVSADTKPAPTDKADLPQLLHHVFFWLKNPGSAEDRATLIAGIRTLGTIESVRAIHVGVPASTEERDVVESSYDVSELLCFDDLEGQEAYQRDPIHQKFVDNHSHLWDKVVVYDVIAAANL